MTPDDLKALIRDVPDFPKPGIVFKDIMPLLSDAEALRETIEQLAAWAAPRTPDLVLGAEARGYITGGALACKLDCGFVADDGERVTIVEFESEETQRAWSLHREHVEAKKKGRASFYSDYRIQICTVQRDSSFPGRS